MSVAPWLSPMLTLAVATGLRLKDITKVRWEDIDRQAKIIHVAMDTKTGTRAIPLNRTASTVLEGLVRHLRNPYVFVDQEGNHFDNESRRNRIPRWPPRRMTSMDKPPLCATTAMGPGSGRGPAT